MAIRTSRCPGMLVTAVLACGPEPADPDDTAGSSGSPASTQPTSADDSGRPALPCVPDEPTDPEAVTCAMRGQADCNGPLNELDECRWIATTRHDPNAATCEPAEPGGACVALSYYGEGCGATDCGDNDVGGHIYFRTNARCEIEVSVESFCGHAVLDWSSCTEASDAPPPPVPDPVACKCACTQAMKRSMPVPRVER